MPTFEYDQRYVEWGLGVLETYLLSDVVYWPVAISAPKGELPYPMFTLEGLLLSMRRLQSHCGRLGHQSQVDKYDLGLEMIRSRWKVAWENKAKRAFINRLKMWLDYLSEYQVNPEANADRYRYEVRLRVFLELLDQDQEQMNRLLSADKFLMAVLSQGEFIWVEDIRAGFPKNTYWYLYGMLPINLKTGALDISANGQMGD